MGLEPILGVQVATVFEGWLSDLHSLPTPQISSAHQEKQKVAREYFAIFQMEKSEAQGGESTGHWQQSLEQGPLPAQRNDGGGAEVELSPLGL